MDEHRLYLQKVAANDENEFIPRLDNRVKFTVTEDNTTYDSVSNTTTFTMELKYNSFDQSFCLMDLMMRILQL